MSDAMPRRSRSPEIGPFLVVLAIIEAVALLLIFLDV